MTNELKPCPFCGKAVAKITSASELFDEEHYSHSEAWAVMCDASKPDGPGGCGASGGFKPTKAEAIAAWNRRAPVERQAPEGWQPIETAPKGAHGYAWMMLAWGDDDDQSTGEGFRCGDRFFAAGTFCCLGMGKQYELREIEVQPTHWMPLPASPSAAPSAPGSKPHG